MSKVKSSRVDAATGAGGQHRPLDCTALPIPIPRYLLEGDYSFSIGAEDDGRVWWFVDSRLGSYHHDCPQCRASWENKGYPHAFCPHCGASIQEAPFDYMPPE